MRNISLLFLLFISCNSLRHYQKVALDTEVTPKKKAIIAPFVSIHFPVQNKYVKGETIIDTLNNYDTIYIKQNDTIIKQVIQSKLITKKIVDTIFMTNEAERYALQETILNYESDIKELQDVNNKQENKINDLKQERNILLVGLFLLTMISCFIMYKIFFR